ncbi:MAG: hypothetical protein JST82_13775 [Bacteroidetes bacterium]|nr:hypothetical protein [Bacteroidota bacterium]
MALVSLTRQAMMMYRELTRIRSNQQLMQQTQQQILLANGRIAAQTGVLQLKQQEFSSLFPELHEEIKTLGLKIRNVQTVSTLSLGSNKMIIAPLYDSILYPKNDTVLRFLKWPADSFRLKTFSYHDSYYDVSGYTLLDKQVLHICTRDTMTQLIYKKRIHPWLWIFSRKQLLQRVYFKNPNAHIYYSRTIQLQR